jgi:hypothetical protein
MLKKKLCIIRFLLVLLFRLMYIMANNLKACKITYVSRARRFHFCHCFWEEPSLLSMHPILFCGLSLHLYTFVDLNVILYGRRCIIMSNNISQWGKIYYSVRDILWWSENRYGCFVSTEFWSTIDNTFCNERIIKWGDSNNFYVQWFLSLQLVVSVSQHVGIINSSA